jgi:hypothetical protein
MALKHRIGKSQTLPFQINCIGAVEVIVIFSGEVSRTVYERFSYPQRGDSSDVWTLLDVDSTGQIFSGVLSEDATGGVADDYLVCDVKAWDALGKNRVKRYRIRPLASTEVETINSL